jgi:hypothetical protein
MNLTLRRIVSEAGVPVIAVGLSLALGGCAYHGSLRPGFYSASSQPGPLPLRAALVIGDNFEAGEYYAERVFFDHSVQIKTSPALKQALVQATQSLFSSVQVVRSANVVSPSTADVVILPSVEMRENVLSLKLAVKDPESGETLREYQAAGNVVTHIPASAHALAIINFCFCLIPSPIVTPITTHLVGVAAEESLEKRLASNLSQITEDIRNDRALVARAKGVRPQPEASLDPERLLDARGYGAHRE